MFQRVFPIFAVKIIIRFYIKFGSLVQFEAHTFIVAITLFRGQRTAAGNVFSAFGVSFLDY